MSSLLGPHTGFDSRESPSRSRQVRRRAPRVLLPIARRYRRGRRPQSNDFCAQLPKSSAFETSADAEPEPAVKKVCLTRSASSFARLATMPVNIAESEIVRSELGSLVAERDRSRKELADHRGAPPVRSGSRQLLPLKLSRLRTSTQLR